MKTNPTTTLLLFSTNISELCSNCELHKTLTSHPEVNSWSLDNDDPDCVLRIESSSLTYGQAATIIEQHGFSCSELI